MQRLERLQGSQGSGQLVGLAEQIHESSHRSKIGRILAPDQKQSLSVCMGMTVDKKIEIRVTNMELCSGRWKITKMITETSAAYNIILISSALPLCESGRRFQMEKPNVVTANRNRTLFYSKRKRQEFSHAYIQLSI